MHTKIFFDYLFIHLFIKKLEKTSEIRYSRLKYPLKALLIRELIIKYP